MAFRVRILLSIDFCFPWLLFGQGFNHIYIHTHSICQRISDFKFNEARSPLFLSLVESSFTFTWGYTIQGEWLHKVNSKLQRIYNTIISNPKREAKILFNKFFSSTIMYHGLLYITAIHQQNRYSAVSPFFSLSIFFFLSSFRLNRLLVLEAYSICM